MLLDIGWARLIDMHVCMASPAVPSLLVNVPIN